MSLRASTGADCACSGEKYWAVPSTIAVCVTVSPDPARVLRFPAETLDEMGVPAILSQQRLDRDRTPQDAVFPQENLSHPARTELISQLIAVGEDADVVRARTHVSPWTDRRHRPFDPSRRRNGSTPPEVAFSRWKVMASSSSPRPVLARSTLW